ncbi:MAG: thioredoxin family protein [Pseudomonadota bacterium]
MTTATVASRDDWLKTRLELLEEEKAFLRARDALSAKRRELPWVKIEKDYRFQSPEGERSLADLFGGASQLIVQHFMMGPGWENGCPSCSFWADGYDGTMAHMAERDAAFVAISAAPLSEIEAFRSKMGWTFPWASSEGSDFNRDFQASFTDEEMAAGEMYYNFRTSSFPAQEAPGASVFAKDDDGTVYHTYSCYARGLDMLNVVYQYLDLLPKGRDEQDLPHPMAWVRRHNEYGT